MTAPTERPENTVDPKLLEILVCPLTKGPLEFDSTRQELISRSAKLAYPIRDGIPIMKNSAEHAHQGGERRETGYRHHQTLQTRRGPRGADTSRRPRHGEAVQ